MTSPATTSRPAPPPESPQPDTLELTGLDGSNPLAFLAALGTLRMLSIHSPRSSVRLHWVSRGSWCPVLSGADGMNADAILDALEEPLRSMSEHPALTIDRNLKIPPAAYRQFSLGAVDDAATTGNRTWPDFAAAFGCDALEEDGVILDTAFRTMSGAGHQHFLETMKTLAELTTREDLERSLFQPWDYADDRPSLRWDPADDRRYALRWKEPSGEPIRTMRGANRLAIEALPLFPTAPVGSALETTGFQTGGSRHTFFTWPIWETPASLDVVRSLLSLPEIQQQRPRREVLRAMGIVDVFRSQRLTIGKFRNFAPARSV